MILKKNKNVILILGILIVFSFFIRSYHISNESLYGDEPFSIFQAQKNLSELKEIFLHDQNPPIHIALLHFWLNIFGLSDVSAKMFSVVCSVLAGLVLFIFAKKYFGNKLALAVSFLFLFSNAQQFYATEVRPYALIQLLCITSFYFYFNIISFPKKRDILFLFLANTVLLFTHYLTIFIFVVQFVGVLLFVKKDKKILIYYFVSQGLVILAFLPWVKILLANIPKEGSFWSHAPNYDDFRWHINLLIGNSNLFYMFLFLAILFLFLVILHQKKQIFTSDFNTRYYLIFLSLFVLPIILDFVVAQYTPVFLTRYILYSTFGLFLMIAYCIVHIKMNNIYKLVFILPILTLIFSSFKITQEREDDWKHFVPMIQRQQNNKTIILVCASYKYRDFSFYYDFNAFKNYNKSIELLAQKKVYFSPKDEWFGWEKIDFSEVEKIIYVQSHNQFEDPENKNQEFILSKGFKECDSYKRINTGYTMYVKEGVECNPISIISEVRNENCDVFKKFLGIDSDKDSVSIYETSFEKNAMCAASCCITEEKFYDGMASLVINEKNQFSPGITKAIKQIYPQAIINVKAYVNCEKDNAGRVVVSVEKGTATLFRNELYIPDRIKNMNVWEEVNMKAVLPNDLPEDAIVKVYFWNPAKPNLFIDGVKIFFN
jgi:hypothetical protein